MIPLVCYDRPMREAEEERRKAEVCGPKLGIELALKSKVVWVIVH